jgi:hypothetical protein
MRFPTARPYRHSKTKIVEALADMLHRSPKSCSKWIVANTRWNTKWPGCWVRSRIPGAAARPSLSSPIRK